jgi:hypothetical protein
MLIEKLIYYASYKTTFSVEIYVHVLDIVKFRKCFASFTCSVHNLLIIFLLKQVDTMASVQTNVYVLIVKLQ